MRKVDGVSFQDEPDLEERIGVLEHFFAQAYHGAPDLIVRSPGRAEILGCHTDYNQGFALACAISRSIVALFKRRTDDTIRVRSDTFPGQEVTFRTSDIQKEETPERSWSNYVRAVVAELIQAGGNVPGADILLGSAVPSSGGVSSSAALELAIAAGLSALASKPLEPMEAALLCKHAENGPLVGTPCGFLDQAAVAFGQSGKMVLLDFQPVGEAPFSVTLVDAGQTLHNCSFVITVDPEVKRHLGETGYPARRKMCEQSLPHFSELLRRNITSLREVSVADFAATKNELERLGGTEMRMRVEHIVYENDRVLRGVAALKKGDVREFGQLLTASGRSALELYALDEKTPELTLLVETQRALPGVLGARNMGGGFSAVTLSLLPTSEIAGFQAATQAAYQAKYGRQPEFIEFQATQGVEVL